MPEQYQKVLKAVSQIAETLLRSPRWEDEMSSVLSLLGESVQVSRAYLFECMHLHSSECTSNIRFEWVDDGISPQINNPELQGFSWKDHNLLEWKDVLSRGMPLIVHIDELPDKVDRAHFFKQEIKSLLLVPIISDSEPLGFLGFDECRVKREWGQRDIQSLRSVANILGAAIIRQEAETCLRIANERFQMAEKAGGIGSWDWNIQTGDLVWSESIEAMFGFSEGQFDRTYEAFLDCVHPEDREGLDRAVRASLDGDHDYYYQHRIVWPDGSIHWILETGEVTRNLQGKPVRMVGIVQDVTNNVFMNLALEDSEQRFRDLVESTSDWIWEVDADGRYTYVSPKVEDILGYQPEELLGKTPFAFMAEQETEKVARLFKDTVEKQSPISQLVNVNIHKDGHEVVLETSGVPIIDETGALRGYRGIDRDISERQLLEVQRLQHEREQKSALVREVHHRIKNNLQSIVGLLRLQLGDYVELSDVLERVIGQVQSIALIHGLQGRSGGMYLCEMVHAIGEANRSVCVNQQELRMDIQSDLPLVIREEELVPIALIINELLTNAIKHGPATRGIIQLSLLTETGRATVQIDNALRAPGDDTRSEKTENNVGLDMISVLMPPSGADLTIDQDSDTLSAQLVLCEPVIDTQRTLPRAPVMSVFKL